MTRPGAGGVQLVIDKDPGEVPTRQFQSQHREALYPFPASCSCTLIAVIAVDILCDFYEPENIAPRFHQVFCGGI
jgi:hypothetical protein